MLRALLLILLLVVVIGLILVWTGFIELSRAPAGEARPNYEVQVNPPEVGTANVQVPVIRPADAGQPEAPPQPLPANAQ